MHCRAPDHRATTCKTRGTHPRTPKGTNLKKTPTFSGALMQTIQSSSKSFWTYDDQTQSTATLFKRFLTCSTSLPTHNAGKTYLVFAGKLSSATKGSGMVGCNVPHVFLQMLLHAGRTGQVLALSFLRPRSPAGFCYFEVRGVVFWAMISFLSECSKVPEGHRQRGTTLREALRGNLPLRGVLRRLCGGLFRGSAGLYRALQACTGFCEGSTGFSEGSDPMLVTLRNCWRILSRLVQTTVTELKRTGTSGQRRQKHLIGSRSLCLLCREEQLQKLFATSTRTPNLWGSVQHSPVQLQTCAQSHTTSIGVIAMSFQNECPTLVQLHQTNYHNHLQLPSPFCNRSIVCTSGVSAFQAQNHSTNAMG